MTRAVRLVGVGWLVVSAYYVSWAYAIGRQVLSGTQLAVGAWTIATPFVILGLAPIGAVLTWGSKGSIGRALLFVAAANWLSWAVIGVHMLRDWAWTPTLLKAIFFLSVITIIVIGAEWLSEGRTRRVSANARAPIEG
jgi:hypothetical protein